ncbi:glutathione S-transferase family protein [Thalassococcus sp. S3]|uniref:glutathione S-transferase family protein n=1 Tax=Thalassococcus sp. S3 TaxID=2017482 RepID=UPI0013EEC8E1|nr:glutathione S-transferase family protein [Thalassococcus sp. S3]
MKIYQFKSGANPPRVRAFLIEKGILETVEFVHVDVANGVNRQPEFKAKNTKGTLPVLELDDGTFVAESVAICRYFEVTYPDPPLMGVTAKDQAVVEMWNRRIELGLFRHCDDIVRNTLEFFQDKVIQDEAVVRVGRQSAKHECEWLDAELLERRYVAGQTFTIADITLYAAFFLGARSIIGSGAQYPNLARWYSDVSQRESLREFA